MTGVAVKGKDRAGGKQSEQANDWFRLDDDPVVTVGDTVEPHGNHTPAPTMVEGENWFLVDDTPVCRAENNASCGHATTGRQWFLLEQAHNGYRPYLTDPGDPCNIEHIPWIMRANGWYEGAKLMDQWFSRTASTEKKPEDSDTTTITMYWVLDLDEARQAYDELMNEALWTVPNDRIDRTPLQRLCASLRNKGFLTDQPMEFTFDTPVWNLKGRQFDDRIIRKGEFGEDPLFIFDKHGAALGQFELLLVAAGEVQPLPDGVTHRITLLKKGVFMEDQYDFEGHQFLGFWDIENHRASLLPSIPPSCLSWVDNGSFRSWRDRNNKGGDYFVYSDVKQEAIDPPIVFYCPSGDVQT